MKSVKFLPQARAEFRDATTFYDERAVGLGTRFVEDVENAIRRIREMPEAWPEISPDVRRCLLQRFPYSILYRSSKTRIDIVAVMHQHRRPSTWVRR